MTYDPDTNSGPNNRAYRRQGMGMGLWIGILAVLAIATFLIFSMGRNARVATDDRPAGNAPATTGSGANSPAPAIRDRATGTNPPPANAPAPAPR